MFQLVPTSRTAVLLAMALSVSRPSDAQNLSLSRLAGAPGGAGDTDGLGKTARFNWPAGVAVDSAGNIYVTDSRNDTIRKIAPGGLVSTVAGATGQEGLVDGTGSAARFLGPGGVAVDSTGNVYVSMPNTIRKVTPAGAVTTLAGTGIPGSSDGTGTAARFDGPNGLAVDAAGNVYVVDSTASTIRRVTPAGVVTTVAGSYLQGGSADGTGGAARFDHPEGAAVDAGGNLYVCDTRNHTIRKVTPAGAVTTYAGAAGQYGSADGPIAQARFNYPSGLAIDAGGNLYVADASNLVIRKISSAGMVTTLAGAVGLSGSVDGPGTAARFVYPKAVAVDAAGNVTVADTQGNTVRKITPGGLVSTLAGYTGAEGFADGVGSAALFRLPAALAADGSGNVFVADTGNHAIRKVTPGGVVSTVAGTGLPGYADGTGTQAAFGSPEGIAVDASGNVFVSDTTNCVIRKITPQGVVTTVAGARVQCQNVDGAGTAARLSFPQGMAFDSAGNLYFASGLCVVRKMTPQGAVTTVAGTPGVCGFDGTTTASSPLFDPTSVAVDTAGNLYIADSGNNRIRKVTPGGVASTLAGGALGGPDGTGTAAGFYSLSGLTIDTSGNLFVADNGGGAHGNRIRRVTPAGVVTTVAGSDGHYGNNDGVGAAARLWGPRGIAAGPDGSLFIADTLNSDIRRAQPAGPIQPCSPSATTLCLNQSRFSLSVAFTNYNDGSNGVGKAVPLTSDSGYFWFFDSANVELMVKVLDGRQVNGAFWVLYGALSDVGYTITITDTTTGAVRSFVNAPHTLASVADITAFPASREVPVPDGSEIGRLASLQLAEAPPVPDDERRAAPEPLAACVPASDTLCLNASRFQLRVGWTNYNDGSTGPGRAVPLTSDSGTFWFFDAANIELVVKVLDGRAVNGYFWVLYGALSDVAYQLTVTDTVTGKAKVFTNPAHTLASVADIQALAP